MVNLTINNQKVQVEEGTTILEAAKSIGIEIPTLCDERCAMLKTISKTVFIGSRNIVSSISSIVILSFLLGNFCV